MCAWIADVSDALGWVRINSTYLSLLIMNSGIPLVFYREGLTI